MSGRRIISDGYDAAPVASVSSKPLSLSERFAQIETAVPARAAPKQQAMSNFTSDSSRRDRNLSAQHAHVKDARSSAVDARRHGAAGSPKPFVPLANFNQPPKFEMPMSAGGVNLTPAQQAALLQTVMMQQQLLAQQQQMKKQVPQGHQFTLVRPGQAARGGRGGAVVTRGGRGGAAVAAPATRGGFVKKNAPTAVTSTGKQAMTKGGKPVAGKTGKAANATVGKTAAVARGGKTATRGGVAAAATKKPKTQAELDQELEAYYGNDPNRKQSALDNELDEYWGGAKVDDA